MRKSSVPAFRHKVIDNCLRNVFNVWTKDKLIEKINYKLNECLDIEGISDRTFYNDIRDMKSEPPRGYNAPIICRNGEYAYEDPNYTIFKDNLSDDDIDILNKSLAVLSQFEQLPIHNELFAVKEKILGYTDQESRYESLIEFEHQEVEGTKFLGDLYPLLKDKKVIKIQYKSFRAPEPQEFIVHPYRLKQYKNRWYLVCYCETHEVITVYALDRFIMVSVLEHYDFREVDIESLNNRFRDIIGVTKYADAEILEINIWVATKLAPYVLTKKIHYSQRVVKEDSSGMTICVKLCPNYEFYSMILGFGEDIKILSPKSVVDELREKIRSVQELYIE